MLTIVYIHVPTTKITSITHIDDVHHQSHIDDVLAYTGIIIIIATSITDYINCLTEIHRLASMQGTARFQPVSGFPPTSTFSTA